MPTYQYACTTESCGNEFELVQTFTEPSASTCPVCGGPVRKVFSAVGVVFKGSGFYRTDSRAASSSAESASKAESAPKSDSAGKSSDSSGSSNGSSSDKGSSDKGSSDKGASASPAPATTGSSSSGKAAASA